MSISILNESAVREAKNVYFHSCDAGRLSSKDLLTVILEPIVRDRSISAMVDDILQNGLSHLGTLSEFELSVLFGLDERQSFQLMSVFELAKRMNAPIIKDELIIRSPEDVKDVLQDLKYLDREHFVTIYLNAKNHMIGRETISVGSLDASIAHPREIFKGAIRRGAANVIFAHNHPSGIPDPSPEDIMITQRLAEVGIIVGIEVMDHIIIGGDKYYSFQEHGTFPVPREIGLSESLC
jgi:DNA repair protein RadC